VTSVRKPQSDSSDLVDNHDHENETGRRRLGASAPV